MLTKQLELTNEQTSPLFRIMWIYNINEPNKRQYGNNICAFHIGNGFIMTVAHNLRTETKIFQSIEEASYLTDILPHLNAAQRQLFDRCFPLNNHTNKRYKNNINPNDTNAIIDTLRQINYDTRWLTQSKKNICKPHLIIQFKNNLFYDDAALTGQFHANNFFHEPSINRHTFLIELELVDAYYNEDIALYRIINTPQDIIDRLPHAEPNFDLLDDRVENYYCLQSSPTSEVGKLLNKAHIEGYLEHFGVFPDRIGGNYTFEGIRYLIKGYFRFGSSGAPYLFYDENDKKFKVNAVQSEACPIQLSINNKKDGNFQYINAIASPLTIIQDKIEQYII